jgi:SnoaL-like domain
MNESSSLLSELAAEREIRRVMANYIRANDRLQLQELADTYHPDAYDDHGTYKGDVQGLVAWIAKRHESIEQSMHLTSNSVIELDGEHAHVETYCLLFQHERTGCVNLATRQPSYRRFVFGLRYVDRFEKRSNSWKVAHRVVVWEWAQEEVGSLTMDPAWVTAQRSRQDAVFQNRYQSQA